MLSTLFCLKGTDTRGRFVIIIGGSWALLLVLPILFGFSLQSLLLTLPAGFIVYATAIRATSDCFPAAVLLVVLYILAALVMAMGMIALFVVATIVAVIPLTILLRQTVARINGSELGYLAPGKSVSVSGLRREPVFGLGETEVDTYSDVVSHSHSSDRFETANKHHTLQGANIIERATSPKFFAVIVLGIIAILSLLLNMVWHDNEEPPVLANDIQHTAEQVDVVIEKVQLPDGFSLGLIEGRLVVSWLGEMGKTGELWSQATAIGDKSCTVLRFNNGSEYRPLSVNLTAEMVIEAWFSPLDSQLLIRDVAQQSSATLCGYSFSLKGTLSRLSGHRAFAPYL